RLPPRLARAVPDAVLRRARRHRRRDRPDRLASAGARSQRAQPRARAPVGAHPRSDDLMSDPGLHVTDITVRFGGNVVLNGVTVDAPLGRLTGLPGPNGAGKTTLFNVCSGLLRPTSGNVRLFGDDVSSLGPAPRARLGLGRPFHPTAF